MVKAQQRPLDPTMAGMIPTMIGTNGAANYRVAIQANGQMITAGSGDNGCFIVERYNADGSLDDKFGTNGIVVTPIGRGAMNYVNGLALQADGSIIQAGTAIVNSQGDTGFALVRYMPDGSLDTSFGTNGIVLTNLGSTTTAAYGIAVQLDGKILATGTDNNNFAVARYNNDGSLDDTFGTNGIVTTAIGVATDSVAYGATLQNDDTIVVTGTDGTHFVVVRYMPDGSLDTTFGSGGIVVTPIGMQASAYCPTIQTDGAIIAAGIALLNGGQQSFALARYLTDGSLDTTFGTNGIVTTQLPSGMFLAANSVTVQANGKVVVGARFITTRGINSMSLCVIQ